MAPNLKTQSENCRRNFSLSAERYDGDTQRRHHRDKAAVPVPGTAIVDEAYVDRANVSRAV